MNRIHSLLGAALLVLASVPAAAHDWGGNPDIQQSILNDHPSDFIGTSLASTKLERGSGDTYGWIVLDVQAGASHVPHQSGDSHGPEMGFGETYGSVINGL